MNKKALGDYDKSSNLLEIGEKITKKTPTIDKISKLYGWLREEYVKIFLNGVSIFLFLFLNLKHSFLDYYYHLCKL